MHAQPVRTRPLALATFVWLAVPRNKLFAEFDVIVTENMSGTQLQAKLKARAGWLPP